MCASTLLTVIEYILQFVGLRALEWPVVVSHLGAALLQVVLRAVARRGLALDPPAVGLQDTQELASFCLAIAQTTAGFGNRPASFVSYIGKLRTWSPKVDSRWEFVTGELLGLEHTPHRGCRVIDSFPCIRPLLRKSPVRSSIKRRPGGAHPEQETRLARDLPEVNLFLQVASQHPGLIPPEMTAMGHRLANAVMGVIDWLGSRERDDIGWKDGPIFDLLDTSETASVTWEVTLIRRCGRSGNFADMEALYPVEFPLRCVDSSSLNATLCFWLHTLAARHSSMGTRFNQEDFYKEQEFCRVMALKRPYDQCGRRMLQGWTGRRMYEKNLERHPEPKLEMSPVQLRDTPLGSISFGMHLICPPG